MTEEEAKKKLCPLLPVHKGRFINCRVSDCMMWRWKWTEEQLDSKHENEGDCKLKNV